MASLITRGKTYYIQWRVGKKLKRKSLQTTSYQIAREKLLQFESARMRGEGNPLPTQTPLSEILSRYVEHVRAVKTPKSAQTDVYYLRQMFGPICPALRITSRRPSIKTMKRPPKLGQDRRFKIATIEVDYLEQITTADISNFITAHVKSRGLAPKTTNRYREIVNRLFNWAMEEQGVRVPGNVNPASKVAKYKENAPEIRFLSLEQIEKQMHILRDNKLLRTMVATYIYSGLRREEALWLTVDDVDLSTGANGVILVRAKTVNGQFWQPKTKRNRAVPISSILRSYLENYTPMLTKERWFFPSPKGKLYDPDNFSRDLRKANRKAGLSWTCLHFRHTFGSQLAIKGVSLYKISTIMGNSPEICQRHYAALIPESLADSVEFQESTALDLPRSRIRIIRARGNVG